MYIALSVCYCFILDQTSSGPGHRLPDGLVGGRLRDENTMSSLPFFFICVISHYGMENKYLRRPRHLLLSPLSFPHNLTQRQWIPLLLFSSLWVFLLAVFHLEAVPILVYCHTVYTTLKIEAPQAPLNTVICPAFSTFKIHFCLLRNTVGNQ
jgi:hypothetical protein